jgi:hypothetical protein
MFVLQYVFARVVVRAAGAELVALVPLGDLRRLEALEAEKSSDEKQNGLDLFIAMAGQVRSGEHDVSAEKYRHLAEAYTTKP